MAENNQNKSFSDYLYILFKWKRFIFINLILIAGISLGVLFLFPNTYKATTIIISHRISTVSEADLIIVLEDGMIVEQGTHEELIRTEGLYKRIYEIQSSIEDDLELELEV